MSIPCHVSRRAALGALAFGLVAIAGMPATAAGDIYVHAGANFKPVTVAVAPFAGEETGDKISGVVTSDFARSIFLLPLNPASFPETAIFFFFSFASFVSICFVDSSSIRAVGAGQKRDRIPQTARDPVQSITSSPKRRASHLR